MKFKNLKIRQKLLVSFGVILIGSIGFAAYAIFSIIQLKELQNNGHEMAMDALQAKELESVSYKMYQIIADAQLNGYTDKIEKEWFEHRKVIQNLMKAVEATAHDSAERKVVAEADILINEAISIFEENMIPLIQTQSDIITLRFLDAEVDIKIEEFQKPVSLIIETLNEEMDEGNMLFASKSNIAEIAALVISVLLLIISIIVIMVMNNLLAKPLIRGVNFTQKVADGDLTANLEINQDDEVGQLVKAIKKMSNTLKDIVSQVINSSEQIASSSEQLSGSSEQVSQGANEQASSVEEVSATMEQMVSNIEQNTQNALATEKISANAADGVKKVSEAAQKSLHSVKNISGKISIINDIAFQTNILALNAAVEAARAGEHGRGFAVVAAEVRKLAERSKVAADEIILLSNESVNATEGAGKLMADILPDIDKTAQLVKEIAAASIEQNNGANQVNNALIQLNSIVQQNASSSEEMASSSEELTSQAQMLNELIGFFNIGNSSVKIKTTTKSEKNKVVVASMPKTKERPEASAGVNIKLTRKNKLDDNFESF